MSLLMYRTTEPSATKIGGMPNDVAEFDWPCCGSCQGPMQFIAQIRLSDLEDQTFASSDKVLLIFMCQNDPGLCDEWDADLGGNAALVTSSGSTSVRIPDSGNTLLGDETYVILKPANTDDSSLATEAIGALSDSPQWLQGDETPECECGQAMRLVAMMQEHACNGLNFGGGGIGYAFLCPGCRNLGKFLFQC